MKRFMFAGVTAAFLLTAFGFTKDKTPQPAIDTVKQWYPKLKGLP